VYSEMDTVLLSECQVEHEKCPITTYYKGRIKEMCMCRCHEHARPSRIRDPEPIVGIEALKGIHGIAALNGIH
jgi:hypothetical protein